MKKRIFYHDTDCGGVVYYANYLKYLEEARTLFLEEKGVKIADAVEKGLWFVVKRQEIDYRAPAFYADELEINTSLKEITPYRLIFACDTFNQKKILLNKSITELVCVDRNLKTCEIPQWISEKLK